MMKNFSLKYGKSEVSFVLDGARSIQTLTENPMNTIEDIHAAFLKAVSTDVIESPALDQLVSPDIIYLCCLYTTNNRNYVESVQKGILWQLLYRIKSDDSNTWMVNRCIYHILRKTVTCDTFPEVKLYIFFLTREIHRKNRRSRCFGAPLTNR